MASRHAQTGKENSTLQRLRRKSGDSSKEDASTSYRLQPAASSSSAAPQENNNPLVARKPLATLSSAPVMPSFDIAEDEEDDPEEESHLINVLQKLQNAKRNIDSSRHKRKAQQMVEETLSRYRTDSQELVEKFNKKWAARSNALQQRCKKIKTDAEEALKSCEDSNNFLIHNLEQHKCSFEKLLQSLSELRARCLSARDDCRHRTAEDVESVRKQVSNRLDQVHSLLVKTHARAMKDDKFTKIIKTFLSAC